MQKLSTTTITLALLLVIPGAIAFENSELSTWQKRLTLPSFTAEPNLHTPRFPEAIYLPASINESTSLGGSGAILTIAETTTIHSASKLTILPGTVIAFHEHGKLVVEGGLEASGLEGNRIHFVSNEVHPDNRSWGGVEIRTGGTAAIRHATFTGGNPSISCLQDSRAIIDNIAIELGNVGIYTETDNCRITNSTIIGTNKGIVTTGNTPNTENTEILSRDSAIFTPNAS